jgi:transcriptional regulator with XRE-family HTH domain
MKSRILKFLSSENKTSAQFAEEIGVQPSGVSHILSGRNNPSLDFVMKMLNRYPNLSTEWLLFGREPMFKRTHNPTLFDDLEPEGPVLGHSSGQETDSPIISNDIIADVVNPSADTVQTESGKSGKKVERILFFYSDRSFREYNPD